MTEHKQSENCCECCILAAQQAPVAGARCKIIDNCKSCQHSAGRQSCMLANRAFEGRERPPTPPDWCPLPLYAAPQQPVQQEPGAWIEHEWSGTGLRHLHFEKREPTVREEVVNPVWTPLYTAPQPARQPLTDEQMWSDDRIMGANSRLGLLMEDLALLVRAVEAAHGITGGQPCPLDKRESNGPSGCFWTCMFFQGDSSKLTQEKVVQLYDKRLIEAVKRLSVQQGKTKGVKQ